MRTRTSHSPHSPHPSLTRRDVVRLAGAGVGVAFLSRLVSSTRARAGSPPTVPASATPGGAHGSTGTAGAYFVQLSDTHWGYNGAANPEADVTLKRAIDVVNALDHKPQFAVFTGDLTHDTDDAKVRVDRLKQFRDIVAKLDVKEVHFLAGEHDAQKDRGDAYRAVIGEPRWSFDEGGVHFVGLDNATDATGALGAAQLAWLDDDLAKARAAHGAHVPLVVFAHRPLFELYRPWDWFTADGAKATALLEKHGAATVFYGHIHQEHHVTTGHVEHHAARSLIFPLPAAGSQPKRAPLPWDRSSPDHGLGLRTATVDAHDAVAVREIPLVQRAPAPTDSAVTPPGSAGGW